MIDNHIGMGNDQIQYRIRKSIHEKDPKAMAYLFGSRARGDFRPDSDWDILILVDDDQVTNEIEDKFRDDLYDIELESGQIISTIIYPKDYWKNMLVYSPLFKNVTREGILL
ncbi:MAG: nucleotidyltransferase domain-containing protein [Prolixibacteraceae bacterium]|nr:nucleotidyltransferase domain-containing protein [Prolixibacteraceae bacterium]